MRPELKDKLDREVNRRRRNWFFGSIAILCPFLIFGLIFVPISSSTIQGESISLTALQTELGSLPRMQVRLVGGEVVRATMTQQQSFISGAPVNLQERTSILGLKRYRVLGYIAKKSH